MLTPRKPPPPPTEQDAAESILVTLQKVDQIKIIDGNITELSTGITL